MSFNSRYKLTLAYDGTNYVGWQIQNNGLTVQAVLEKALHRIGARKGRPVGSGRTDAGVHALGQVAHVDLKWSHTPTDLQNALNSLLPEDIVIRHVEAVPADFHAQKSARQKWYRYVICEGPPRGMAATPIPRGLPFGRQYAWNILSPLRIGLMRKAAKHLQGRHDFKSFQGSGGSVKTTVRTLKKIAVRRYRLESPLTVGATLRGCPQLTVGAGGHGGPPLLVLDLMGNGFLKQMVRNIVGLLVEVGQGKRSPVEARRILLARDRKAAGLCAPPQGLYLMNVDYD